MISTILSNLNIPKAVYRLSHWRLSYVLGKATSPLACGLYITSRCNFACKFCNIWRIKPAFQYPEDEAKKVIKGLAKGGLIYFSISGGEPLTVPYIFDLLKYAKDQGILYTHVVSNAFLIDEAIAKKFDESMVSEVSFSIDGEQAVHDQARQKAGAYKHVLEAVDLITKFSPNTKIVLNTILDPHSPENALYAVGIAEKLDINIKVQPANNHPQFGLNIYADTFKRSFNDDQRHRLDKAIEIMQTSPNVISSESFLSNYKRFLFDRDNLMLKDDHCIFGYHHIEIFNNQLFPCLEGMDWENGFNIGERDIDDIIRSKEYRSQVSRLTNCKKCRDNYYVCYYEPRLNFPIWNYIKTRLNR
jgi:MoaA/NifB/PqqE/SkfB family radical SAM enzyme